MFYPQNDSNGEVKRDHLLESTLGYWSSAPRERPQPDPRAWEAEAPFLSRPGKWVWLLLAILIMLAGALLVVG
jgi:hypothetical protein